MGNKITIFLLLEKIEILSGQFSLFKAPHRSMVIILAPAYIRHEVAENVFNGLPSRKPTPLMDYPWYSSVLSSNELGFKCEMFSPLSITGNKGPTLKTINLVTKHGD